MAHIGSIKERLTLTLTVKNFFRYERPAFGYGYETHDVYIMVDAAGNTFKVDTTSTLGIEGTTKHNTWCFEPVRKGDVIVLKGTVKAHDTYKDEPQTILQRCKVVEFVSKAPSPEDIKKAKKKEQKLSVGANDQVITMLYSRYKEHYSDCETIIDSYNKDAGTIKVIVREGRMKKSGVRYQHFSGYQLTNEEGTVVCYKAISEDNAIKRANKEYPNHTWECTQVFMYGHGGSMGWNENTLRQATSSDEESEDIDQTIDWMYESNNWND